LNEWNVIALLVEKWGLPGLIVAGLGWAAYRFGLHPAPVAPAVTNETAAAIMRLSDKIDAHHDAAEVQRKEVTDALHGLDRRMVRIETTLEVKGN
jgi:hypothetical protein